MRHLYRCPLRWADLDLLGHVNNVVYVDYLQEARVDLMRAMFPGRRHAEELAEAVVVVRHEVTYLAPLGLRFRPVSIECWVTDVRAATFTLAYEVFHDDPEVDGGRRVYVRASTVLTPFVFAEERPRRLTAEERTALTPYREPAVGPPAPRIAPLQRRGAHEYPLHVRFSDVDVYRHVNNVKYFEYLQEARVRMLGEIFRDEGEAGGPDRGHLVVAQTDVEYRRPILLRPEPYAVLSEVSRLGQRSLTIESEIVDGAGADGVLARARVTIVFFDLETGRSTDPDPAVRERYRQWLRPPTAGSA